MNRLAAVLSHPVAIRGSVVLTAAVALALFYVRVPLVLPACFSRSWSSSASSALGNGIEMWTSLGFNGLGLPSRNHA
jgi:hypothetical protein